MTGQSAQRRAEPRGPAPYRNAVIVVTVATIMASLFVTSYTLALGRPVPHHIPAGIVGASPPEPPLVKELEGALHGALDFRPYASTAAAQRAISDEHIYAALVLGPGRPRLLIASAAGASVARVLEQAAVKLSQASPSPPLTVIDVHPLPPRDPQGLASFYVTLGATILGFVTMLQLRANAGRLSLRAWLGFVLGLAVVGGLALTVVVGPLLDALRGPFFELSVALAAEIAVAALFCSTMLVLLGRWAIVPTWLLFVVLGNSSSGGAVAPPLLPPFYALTGRFLPNGATVRILEHAVYFPATRHLEPVLVEAAWLVCCLAALLISVRVLKRGPTGQ
jgi:hypothetical protein